MVMSKIIRCMNKNIEEAKTYLSWPAKNADYKEAARDLVSGEEKHVWIK